jgi:HK97 family phage prohead protease
MTDVLTELPAAAREAAARRKAAAAGKAGSRRLAPNDGERARLVDSPAQLRSRTVERDGKQFFELVGYASIVDRSYDMWDFFGPYSERVSAGAFDATLSAKPDVAFLINHTGLTLARTSNGTLELAADALGLRSTAWLNPQRDEARNLISAIEDKLITEMSFAFQIDEASWNDDFTEFTIERVNLDRGDTSAVNYGANPFTSIAARSQQIMRDVQKLPTGAARAALGLLQHRKDLGQPATPTRALAPADAAVVAQVLGWLSAIDTIVDEGQETLAAYLGVPNPDAYETEDMSAQEQYNSAQPSQKRAAGRSLTHIEALLES